jgi:hypothetical protein
MLLSEPRRRFSYLDALNVVLWRLMQIASHKPVIICLGFDPSVNPNNHHFGCDRLLPPFELMSNDPGFQGIGFYRVDCDSSPDISAFCSPAIIVSVPRFVDE